MTDGTTNGTYPNQLTRGTYYYVTKQNNGNLLYAFQSAPNYDSISIWKIDSVLCTTSKLLSWSRADYGDITQIIQYNPLYLLLDGGALGSGGMYLFGSPASTSQELDNRVNIQIFPNPSSGKITIKTTNLLQRVEIINNLGEVVHQTSVPNTSYEYDVSNQPKGVYFIKVNDNNSFNINKIIVH